MKKGSKRLYSIHALKKCGLTDRQLILVYCSIIRSVLEYASPAWAGLTQYLSDQIESIQKRALKIIFPSLCYFIKMYAGCKCKWIRHLEFAYFSFFLTHLEIEMMQKM